MKRRGRPTERLKITVDPDEGLRRMFAARPIPAPRRGNKGAVSGRPPSRGKRSKDK